MSDYGFQVFLVRAGFEIEKGSLDAASTALLRKVAIAAAGECADMVANHSGGRGSPVLVSEIRARFDEPK